MRIAAVALFCLAAMIFGAGVSKADPGLDTWAYRNGDKVCNWFNPEITPLTLDQAMTYVEAYGFYPYEAREIIKSSIAIYCPDKIRPLNYV